MKSKRRVLRQLHALPTNEVQDIAISVFWYWLYRISEKITQGQPTGKVTRKEVPI